MKLKNLDIRTILIVLLIIVIIILRQCSSTGYPEPNVKIETIETVKYDTIKVSTVEYVPKWINVSPDTVFLETATSVDTNKILADYFATYTYSDTINDDTVTVYINDEISRNRISKRKVSYEIAYPTKTITNNITEVLNEREFYVGPTISASTSSFEFVGVEGIFRSRKNTAFKLNVGINEELGLQMGFGLHWKLKFK